jgi:hypothetical protein
MLTVHAVAGVASQPRVEAGPGYAYSKADRSLHFSDGQTFVAFVGEFIDLADVPEGLPKRTGC